MDYYDWDMCQPQFNILDIDRQASVDGIRYAGKRGIPVVVMEPLKGGSLANVRQRYSSYTIRIRFTTRRWSGVSALWRTFPKSPASFPAYRQWNSLRTIFASSKRLNPTCSTNRRRGLIYKVKAAFDEMIAVPCTACRYCMPCPQEVDIPRIFSMYNEASMLGNFANAKRGYSRIADRRVSAQGKAADACVACGACEAACPQQIPIIEKLKEAHEKMSAK